MIQSQNQILSSVDAFENGTYRHNFTENKATGTYVLFAIAVYFVGIFVAFANVLVIRAVVITEALQTRANMYVVSLASTDALVGVLALLIGTQYLSKAWFDSTEFACLFVFALSYFTVTCSGMNMCLIALDRYFYIVRPLQYEILVSERKVKYAIACVWIMSFLYGLCPLLVNNFDSATKCTIKQVVPAVLRAYVSVGLFLLCCGITSVVYAKIGYVTFRTLKTISRNRASVGMVVVPGASRAAETLTPRRPSGDSLKALKLFAVVFGLLFVCWSPYFTIEVLYVFTDVNESIYFASMVLGFFNSGLNAFVYTYFNKDFRIALKKMLRCRRSRSVSHAVVISVRQRSVTETSAYH